MLVIFFIVVFLLIMIGTLIAASRQTAPDDRRALRYVSLAAACLSVFILLFNTFTIISAGHIGVVDKFGVVNDETLKPGINAVAFYADVHEMSVQTQELKETMEVPSKEGLTVNLEVSMMFHLDPEKAPEIYKTVGSEYVKTILEPQFRSVTRGITALYEAKALYTSDRQVIETAMEKDLATLVGPRGIIVEKLPLRHVGLPPGLTNSIEEKLKAEQESQRMEFVLKKEKQEADRKRLEAQGIHDFQQIVRQGIDENLLRWKGIEATEIIAKSPNTKVVIIGAGKDGLPLLLDTK